MDNPDGARASWAPPAGAPRLLVPCRGGGKLILRCPAANWKISLKLPLFIRGPLQPPPVSVCPSVPLLAVNSIRITRAGISPHAPHCCPRFLGLQSRQLRNAQSASVLTSHPTESRRGIARTSRDQIASPSSPLVFLLLFLFLNLIKYRLEFNYRRTGTIFLSREIRSREVCFFSI